MVNTKTIIFGIYENSKYLKSIVTTRIINTITTNVTNTTSINCHSENIRGCYNFHTVLL